MNLLAFLQALLGLAVHITTYLNNRRLIGAGEAQAIAEGLQNAQDAISKARKARVSAVRKFDERNGLPDNTDPNLRD